MVFPKWKVGELCRIIGSQLAPEQMLAVNTLSFLAQRQGKNVAVRKRGFVGIKLQMSLLVEKIRQGYVDDG